VRPGLAKLLAGTLLLVGCGATERAAGDPSPSPSEEQSSASSSSPGAPSPSAATTASVPGTIVTTADSQFGEMLFDRTGQAIYLFDREATDRPDCYGECAEAWPPVLTEADPRARGGVRQDLLSTTRRSDGTTQVTYGGHPLYFYAHEGKNQVLCHDVREYGGLWLVVQPDGGPAPT